MNFKNKGFECCLNCKYLKELFRKAMFPDKGEEEALIDYLWENIYQIRSRNGDDEKHKQKEEELKEYIRRDFFNKKNLGRDGKYQYKIDAGQCIDTLHEMCFLLKPIFDEDIKVEDISVGMGAMDLLNDMLDENLSFAKVSKIYDRDFGEKEKTYRDNIQRLREIIKEKKTKDEKKEEEKTKGDESETLPQDDEYRDICLNLQNIVYGFCHIDIMNNEYIQYLKKGKNITPILERDDCFIPLFEKFLASQRPFEEKFSAFQKRASRLSPQKQNILYAFLDHAPKHFGHNLEIIMEEKGLTVHDIAEILNGCKIIPNCNKDYTSYVQSLLKTARPTKGKEIVPYICRILLVDKNVLYNGVGKTYGNWGVYLKNDEYIKSVVQTLGGKDNKKEKGNASPRTKIRSIIGQLVSSDESLKECIVQMKTYPGCDIAEIDTDIERNIYSGVEEQYRFLVERESLFSLLTVLENCNLLNF